MSIKEMKVKAEMITSKRKAWREPKCIYENKENERLMKKEEKKKGWNVVFNYEGKQEGQGKLRGIYTKKKRKRKRKTDGGWYIPKKENMEAWLSETSWTRKTDN